MTVEVNAQSLERKLKRVEADRTRLVAAEANAEALRSRLERLEAERAQQAVAEAKAEALRLKLDEADGRGRRTCRGSLSQRQRRFARS
jgi:predicted ribosome quality control (RQC) complex YloA/Tae2 family protein